MVLLVSCNEKSKTDSLNEYFDERNIVVIDSCEYFTYRTYGFSTEITHKGNCKFCAERLKKLIKENK